jgi:hypothetical protein
VSALVCRWLMPWRLTSCAQVCCGVFSSFSPCWLKSAREPLIHPQLKVPIGTACESVRLRWRDVIHPTWIDCPLLYLDATARLNVAERWLGPITRLADVQAIAPHMHVMQVHDQVFGYTLMIARAGVEPGKAARANQRRVAEVMQVVGKAVGGTGLLVGPKAMIAQMQAQGLIPGAWDVANFGALRGVDSFRSVSAAIVVSRQLPPPAEVERMTSIIFASDVQIVSDWYPIRASAPDVGRHRTSGGIRMPSGRGRRGHPLVDL